MSKFIFPKIAQYCEALISEFALIPEGRKASLQRLCDYIDASYADGTVPKLIVICTHNSRRSHLGQLWLAVGADFYGLPALATYSGGTEATAFNSRVVKTLEDIGFEIITKKADSDNPVYKLHWTYTMPPYIAFSKKYAIPPNPTSHFGAIMVCSEADEECPFIPGAAFRLSLPYDDPKAFDDTDLEATKYAERCRQIGREMLYAISLVNS